MEQYVKERATVEPATERPAESYFHSIPEYEVDVDTAILSFLGMLWTERKLLLHIVGWGLALSLALGLFYPPWYTATTQLIPAQKNSQSPLALLSALGGNSALASLASGALGGKTEGGTLVGVLSSRTVQDRLIDQLDLRKEFHCKGYADARKRLKREVTFAEDRKSGIITLSITNRNPVRAAEIANAYVSQLNHVLAQVNSSSAHLERVFLEERLKQVNQDLQDAEKAFSEFSSQNTTLDINAQGKAMLEAGASLQGELIASEAQLRGLQQIYTDESVRVRSLRAHINELRQQLLNLSGKKASGSNLQGSDTQNEQSDIIIPSIRQLPLLGVKYADLFRRTKVQEAIFETLTKQYEIAKIDEAKEDPSVRILDLAVPPEKPAGPLLLWCIVGGLILSSLLAVVTVMCRGYWRQLRSSSAPKVLWGYARTYFQTHSFRNAGRQDRVA